MGPPVVVLLIQFGEIPVAGAERRMVEHHLACGEEQIRGLLGCGLLVGVAFLVNAIAFEFRYVLAPNALFWVFAAFAERHHALKRYAALTGSNQAVPRPGSAWAVGTPRTT